MAKRSEKGVVSRLIRQTSCLFIEIPPRSLKTEFKCHLRLSNGHRAGGDPSKRPGDKRPLLNIAGTAGKVPRPGQHVEERPSLEGPGEARPPLQPARPPRGRPGPGSGSGWGVGGARVRGASCKTTSYLPPPTRPCAPIPKRLGVKARCVSP